MKVKKPVIFARHKRKFTGETEESANTPVNSVKHKRKITGEMKENTIHP